uniref:RNase H type-1 domain-containing protein n=1 Tax=Cannabis sativa TaxID=3483 RepID=A0A803NI00_CANSA
MPIQPCHKRFLGLPYYSVRDKKNFFGEIKEKLWNHLSAWQEQLFSVSGKEVLLKAIAQSIPTYAMSFFRRSKSLINQIEVMMNKFLWGSNSSGLGIKWKTWSALCHSKVEGVAAILHTRHIADSPICYLCHREKEMVPHTLFFCNHPKCLRKASNFDLSNHITWHMALEIELEQHATIQWSIWSERNKEKHHKTPSPHDVLLYFVFAYLEEFQSSRQLINQNTTSSSSSVHVVNKDPPWMNQPLGRLKLNTDVAVNSRNNSFGFGAVLCDRSGNIIATMLMPFPGTFKLEVMEAMALMYGLQWLKDICLTTHFIDIDSLLVVKGLQSSHASNSEFDCLLANISLLVSNFPGAQISHVYRSTNTVAHLLAKYALSVYSICTWMEVVPPPLNACCIINS